MDKNKIIGVLLLVAALGAFYFSAPPRPPPSASPAASVAGKAAPATPGNPASVATAPGPTPATPTAPVTIAPLPAAAPATLLAAVAKDHADATLTTLANSKVSVRLTDFGGAVLDVAFKDYDAEQDKPGVPYVFNAQHVAPILAFTDYPGLDQHTRFERVSATATEVVYRTVLENRLEVTRRYALVAGNALKTDPSGYLIHHETTFRNLLDKQIGPGSLVTLSLGTAAPVNANDFGQYLNVARFNGEKATHIARTDLERGFLAGLGLSNNTEKSELPDPGLAVWGAVKNQFFASIYTPEKPGTGGVVIRRVELGPLPGSVRPNIGITGALRVELPLLASAASTTLKGDLYVGPKEYTRLKELAHSEDKVMQFDSNWYTRMFLSGYVAPAMNTLMNLMHRVVGNWGLAIVLMTLLLKFVSLPFTLAASRSAKRMQKLQPLMAAMREKYKDNPQKLNTATMELFKEHKVNPVGGCLPILITIPLFIGFFNMLQGTAELRFQPFLWATDLSGPDTIGHLPGLGWPVNIMPLLMGATMFYQMKLTPQPTVDNAQQKIFKFMPFFFTLICYSFSCALALYSTINGAFTIVQQLLVNKYAKVEDVAVATTGPGGRPVKNVTPKKK